MLIYLCTLQQGLRAVWLDMTWDEQCVHPRYDVLLLFERIAEWVLWNDIGRTYGNWVSV